MRRMIIFFFLVLVSASAFANARLEQRIYYFSQMTELFRNVCFDPDGTFRENVVMSERGGSIRETAIDCNAQALALDEERKEIEAAIQSAGEDCDAQITDPQLAAFATGITDAAEQVQCPGGGGAIQCTEALACNLTRSLLPRFTQGVQNFLSGRSPGSSCGSDGGSSCIENLLAGAVFNLRDTGCGIASLFGYNCDSEGSQDSEQASSDAAVMASFQSNEQVATFSENPWAWMKQTASAIFTQIGESITERFGCAQWEDPNRPFMSRCLRPMSWSCADCSAKANMVCGVMGYIGGEILVSFFTGAAVGIVARAASRIAIEAATHFPRTTALVSAASGRVVDTASNLATLSARWAGRGGASLRNIWNGISSTRGVQVLSSVATRVGSATVRGVTGAARFTVRANDFGRRRFFAFAATEDLALASVKRFNTLVEESFRAGYRFTGTARASTIDNMLALYPRASDIRSGAYASQGIRNEQDYFRFATSSMTPQERAQFRIGVTRDGADSRVVLVDTTGARAGVGPSYDFSVTPRAPASITAPTVPRNPDVIVRPPAEIVSEPIVVSGSLRNLDRYPIIEASSRSESDLIRAFGGDTPYNRQLATLAREEYRLPRNFENAAYDLHDAWKAANPQLRATRPQAFVDYDDLPAAEKLRYADELERAFRESNPSLISSAGFQEYRASLNGTPVPVQAADGNVVARTNGAAASSGGSITVGGPTRLAGNVADISADVTLRATGRTDGVRDLDRVTDLTTGQTRTTGGAGEDAIRRFGGDNVSYQDREIIMDIILGGPRRNQYFGGRNPASDAFQRRYRELEPRIQADPNLARYRADIEALAAERIATGNRLTDEELADISRSGIRTDGPPREIPCSAFANVTPGAFPGEGNCRRVKFDQDVNGRYCSCGGMGKTSFTWLVRCPTSTSDFRSLSTYVDELALPSNSAPEMCTRVDIPRGKECYIGPTSATFAGFGGTTQILCEHRAPRTDAARADVASFGLDFGGAGSLAVRPVRWSPFSTFPEFQRIIERASRSCAQVCDVNEYRAIQAEFARARQAIAGRGTPEDLARLRLEERNFELYLSELGSGRRGYPTFTDNASAGAFSDRQRVQVADIMVGRVDGVGNERRSAALIRAHEVAPDRGFGTYTPADLREKRSILMYGMNPTELAAYRRANGNRTPPEIFSGSEADTLMRNRIAGRDSPIDADDAFMAARQDATRAQQQRNDLARGFGTMEDLQVRYRSSAQGYQAEAYRQRSPSLARESWVLYSRSGNQQETVRMIQAGVRDFGMNPQSVIDGIRRDVARLDAEIARNSNPALILERDTLRAAGQEAERLLGLSRVAPAAATTVRTPAATPTPQPTPAPEVRPQPAPQPQTQLRPVSEIPVDRAQSLANDYRLGRNNKPQNPARAAELYYRAADGVIAREASNVARSRPQRFMQPNVSSAIEQSLAADGQLAIRIIDDIKRAGGETNGFHAVNLFLAENFTAFAERSRNPVVRENYRRLFQHIQDNYGSQLYDPQRGHLRNWITRQSE